MFQSEWSLFMVRKRALWAAIIGAALLQGCIGERREACGKHSDCTAGFCSARGFCEKECISDKDCPNGSICGGDCGICTVLANPGPATCYAVLQGLTITEINGICREAIARDAASGLGEGVNEPVSVDSCLKGVSATNDGTGGSNAYGGDASTQGATP